MTTAITLTPSVFAFEPEQQIAARSLNKLSPAFGCVYLTSSVREAELTSALLESAQIRIYHAGSLKDAEERLKLTKSRVLLTNTAFRSGNWKDALQMAARLRPQRAVVVAARLADERLWIGVLEHGAYDLVQKPFREDELRRILENAYTHVTIGRPAHMTA